MADSKASSVAEPHHFYINITLLNKDEVVAAKVQEKAGTGIFGKVAGKVANAGMSEDKIVSKLSATLCETLPKTLGEMGIGGSFEEMFHHESLVVFKCSIGEIDQMTLLRGAKGEDYATHFQTMLDSFAALGIESAASNIEASVQSKVRHGMMEKLGDILPEKMLEKGMKVDCSVQGPENQADFFYAHLKTLA